MSDVLKFIQEEIADAEGFEFDEARAYFNAELPAAVGTTAEGGLEECSDLNREDVKEWSSYVSAEVRNAVIATLAEVAPGFFGDQPAEFTPAGPEDEQQAEQESFLVNHVYLHMCKGFEPTVRAMAESLLFKFGSVRIAWDQRTVVKGQRIELLPPEQVSMLQAQGAQITAAEEDRETGTWSVDLTEKHTESGPTVEWVPAEQLKVSQDTKEVDMDECRFISWVREMRRSQLMEFGIPRDLVDRLDPVGESTKDWASQSVMVAESYVLFDTDGDGIAERRRVLTGGGLTGDRILIDDRPWTGQPFVVGVALFDIDSWAGISLFERLREIQDAKTDLHRQMLLTGWRNLLQRLWGLEGSFNPNDLEASVRGGYVRVSTPQAIGTLPDIPLSPVSFQLLEMLDQSRRESGGGAIDMASFAQQVGGETAHGVERVMSSMEQVGTLMARTLAETLIRPIYVKLHALLRENWQGVLQARASGQWMVQQPAQWSPRKDVAVTVGLSAFDRKAMAGALAQVAQQQQLALQSGQDGVLVSLANMHNTLTDFARLMGLPAPEQYWTDPGSPEAQQAAQQKQQSAQQAQEQQAQAAQAQADLMVKLEEIKADVERYRADWGHVAKVNDQLLKLVELAAKYQASEAADFGEFQTMAAGGKPPAQDRNASAEGAPRNGG